MDEGANPVSPIIPIVSTSENKSRKGFGLFKDSWKSLSSRQKFQLVAVFALVLGLPTILGGVYATKLYRSGAATPPTTPTPWPSPTSTSTTPPVSLPVLNTTSLPQIYWNVPYTATVDAYDTSGDALNLSVTYLPSGLALKNCRRYTTTKTRKSMISCTLSGVPATADLNWVDSGIFTTKVTVSNSKGGSVTDMRIPFYTISKTNSTMVPTATPKPIPTATPVPTRTPTPRPTPIAIPM